MVINYVNYIKLPRLKVGTFVVIVVVVVVVVGVVVVVRDVA